MHDTVPARCYDLSYLLVNLDQVQQGLSVAYGMLCRKMYPVFKFQVLCQAEVNGQAWRDSHTMSKAQLQEIDNALCVAVYEWAHNYSCAVQQHNCSQTGQMSSMQAWHIGQVDAEWDMRLECHRYKCIATICATKVAIALQRCQQPRLRSCTVS